MRLDECVDLVALVARLARQAAPTIAFYREALTRGPDPLRIVAAYGLGMIHVDTMDRAAAAIDPRSPLRWSLSWLLVEQRLAALRAFTEVTRIAKANRTNAILDALVRHAQTMVEVLSEPQDRDAVESPAPS